MTLQTGTPVSKFVMFRCMITMAHIDGILSISEKEYMRGILDGHRFSRIQKEVIENDFFKPTDMNHLLPLITDPIYRGQVVHFARMMAHKDGKLHPSEQDLLEKMQEYQVNQDNLALLNDPIRAASRRDMNAHDFAARGGYLYQEPPGAGTWFGYFLDVIYVLRLFM